MKMTLPFKPHVLALICSAGLCAASTGLYIKSRTVEAPVEPQSTQQTAPDITAVTLPATVSAPPVTPAVVKSAFSTAQIDQWVAPVALYPDSLLSQVLWHQPIRQTLLKQCNGRTIIHLNKAMLLFRQYLTSRGTPALNHWWPFHN